MMRGRTRPPHGRSGSVRDNGVKPLQQLMKTKMWKHFAQILCFLGALSTRLASVRPHGAAESAAESAVVAASEGGREERASAEARQPAKVL